MAFDFNINVRRVSPIMNNTIIRTTSVLRLLAQHPDGLTITEICKSLGLAKSTVFDIVHTLEAEKYLEPSPSRPFAFRIGLDAFRIGYAYLQGANLDSVARPILQELNRMVNETIFLAIRSGPSHFVYTMKFLSDAEFQTIYSVGAVRHLLSTALGKAILAALPNDQALICVTPEMYADCSIPAIYDEASLLTFLDMSRKQGYVIDDTSENSHPARPVAAPLLDANNQVIGSISIVAMTAHTSDERVQELGRLAQSTALRISKGLGYMKDDLYAFART